VGLLILGAIAFQGLSHIFALVANGNLNILIIISVTTFLISTVLSNFLLTYSRLHYVFQFMSNFAISRFIFEAIMLSIYGFGRCGPDEIQQLLYIMNLTDGDIFHCIQMLLFNILFYRIIALVLLIRRVNPVENRRKRAEKLTEHRKQLSVQKDHSPSFGVSSSQLTIHLTV